MMGETATQTRYRVEGMDCAGCAAKIDTAVRRLPGILDVAVSATAGIMTVHYNGASDPAAIERAVTGLGYGLAAASNAAGTIPSDEHKQDQGPDQHQQDIRPIDGPWWKTPKALLTATSGAALILAWGLGVLLPPVAPWPFIVAMLVGLVPIARRAFTGPLGLAHRFRSKC